MFFPRGFRSEVNKLFNGSMSWSEKGKDFQVTSMTRKDFSETGISSILNFRDVGGHESSGGRTMKKGVIYRSANPDRINGDDIIKLNKLGIKTIIDLRHPSEFYKKKVEIPGIEIINIPLDFEDVRRQKLKPLIKRKYNPEDINGVISGLYVELVDAIRPVLSRVAELLVEPGSAPLLIHCQAGKDRTGILSALFQLIAGVRKEDIVKDYMASNDYLLPYFEKKLRLRNLITLGLFPSRALLHAIRQKQEDILTVFDRVENHYEGIREYLSGGGFDISKIDTLRDILLEEN